MAWKSLGLGNYFDIIKNPMDLNSIRKKLNQRKYNHYREFIADIQLIWNNAKIFNRPESFVYQEAVIMEKFSAH